LDSLQKLAAKPFDGTVFVDILASLPQTFAQTLSASRSKAVRVASLVPDVCEILAPGEDAAEDDLPEF